MKPDFSVAAHRTLCPLLRDVERKTSARRLRNNPAIGNGGVGMPTHVCNPLIGPHVVELTVVTWINVVR